MAAYNFPANLFGGTKSYANNPAWQLNKQKMEPNSKTTSPEWAPKGKEAGGLDETDWYKKFYGALSGKDKEVVSSAIPYLYNIMGDWLINPSTVSVSTFQRMTYTDTVIGSCLEYMMATIVESIGEYYHPVPEIQEFVRSAFKKLEDGSIKGLFKRMLTAMWAGFSVHEMIVDRDRDGHYIKQCLPNPPSTNLFAVDAEGRVKKENGIMQYIINTFYPGYSNSMGFGIGAYIPAGTGNSQGGQLMNANNPFASEGDLDYPYRTIAYNPVGLVALPTEFDQVIHFTLDGTDRLFNPYGRSLMRKVYTAYVLKYGIMQFLAMALDRKATPLLVVYCDMQQSLSANNPLSTNKAAYTPIALAQEALINVRGNSALLLPGMEGKVYKVDAVKIDGDLTIFIDALKYLDESIHEALMVPSSTFNNSVGASYSLGVSQNSAHGKYINSLRTSLIDCFLGSFVKKTLSMNFNPEEYNQDLGRFDINYLSIDDLLKMSQIFQNCINMGIVLPEGTDINKIREIFGFKFSDDESLMELNFYQAMGQTMDPAPGKTLSPEKKKSKMTNREVKDQTETPYGHWENV